MLEATFAPVFEDSVIDALPIFSEVDTRGGLAVDLGCGNGWYLRCLARRFPKLRGVGLDAFAQNIEGATERAVAEGVSGRLSFRVGDLHRFEVDEPADLIAMNHPLPAPPAHGPDALSFGLCVELAAGRVSRVAQPVVGVGAHALAWWHAGFVGPAAVEADPTRVLSVALADTGIAVAGVESATAESRAVRTRTAEPGDVATLG